MKTTTLLLFISILNLSFGQINVIDDGNTETVTIGKIASLGNLYISLEKTDNFCKITYRDDKFKQIEEFKSFSFYDKNDDLENLYTMIIEGLNNPPESNKIVLELENDIITLKFSKFLGKPVVQILHYVDKNPEVVGETILLTEKKVMKLFGKKKSRKKR